MQPHQQRVVDEKTELDARLVNLNKFFSTEIFSKLPEDEATRLSKQASTMADYSNILGERIAAF